MRAGLLGWVLDSADGSEFAGSERHGDTATRRVWLTRWLLLLAAARRLATVPEVPAARPGPARPLLAILCALKRHQPPHFCGALRCGGVYFSQGTPRHATPATPSLSSSEWVRIGRYLPCPAPYLTSRGRGRAGRGDR